MDDTLSDGVRAKVEVTLGYPLTDSLWELIDERYGPFYQEGSLVDDLVVIARELTSRSRTARTKTRNLTLTTPRAEYEATLSWYAAAEVPLSVAYFRRVVLLDRLLGPGEVQPWIDDRLERAAEMHGWPFRPLAPLASEGEVALTDAPMIELRVGGRDLGAWLPPRDITPTEGEPLTHRLDRAGTEVAVEAAAPSVEPTDPGDLPHLDEPDVDDPWGEVDWLRSLSDQLSSGRGWARGDATWWVMTGDAPSMKLIRARFHAAAPRSRFGERIELVVDPAADPAEVAKAYREARRQVVAGRARVRSQTPKGLRLARFAGARPPGETWAGSLERWNHQYPDDAYTDTKHFGADVGRARRVFLARRPFEEAARRRVGSPRPSTQTRRAGSAKADVEP